MERPDLLKCSCADCGEIIAYPPGKSGQIIARPKCGVRSQLPEAPTAVAPDSYSSANFDTAKPRTCPVCGDRLNATDVSCGFCAKQLRQKRRRMIRVSGGVAAALLVLATFLIVQLRPKPVATNAIPPDGTWLPRPKVKRPKSPEDLKVGKFYLKREKGSSLAIVSGDVENTSENLHRNLKITLELLDASGAKLGTVEDFIVELRGLGTWLVIARTSQTNAVNARFGSLKEDP